MRRGESVKFAFDACGVKLSKKMTSPGSVGTGTNDRPLSESGFHSSPINPSRCRPDAISRHPFSIVAASIVTMAVMKMGAYRPHPACWS